KTNVGQAGSFVASRLAEEPQQALALRSVGAGAASQALKAVAIARRYVERAHPGEDLLVCPREESKPDSASSDGRHLRQLVLVCHRTRSESPAE
ncbi:unnamed protein product, partial [Effrenium voratum]